LQLGPLQAILLGKRDHPGYWRRGGYSRERMPIETDREVVSMSPLLVHFLEAVHSMARRFERQVKLTDDVVGEVVQVQVIFIVAEWI